MPLTTILFFALLISLLLASLVRPVFGALAYLAVYTLYNPDAWWASIFVATFPRPSFIFTLFFAAGCALHPASLCFRITRFELAALGFLLLAWFSTASSPMGFDGEALFYLDKLTKIFIFMFLLFRAIYTRTHLKLIVGLFIAVALFYAYFVHMTPSSFYRYDRLEYLGGTDFRESNQLAAFLSLALIFLAHKMYVGGWHRKPLIALGCIVIMNTIIMTKSRAVFVGLVVAAILVIFYGPRMHKAVTLCFLTLAAAAFLYLSDPGFIYRMKTIPQALTVPGDVADQHAGGRFDLWKASLQMLSDYPMGVGVKHFQNMVSAYEPEHKGRDPHNTYIACYSEIGIPGLAFFMVMLAQSAGALLKIRRFATGDKPDSDLDIMRSASMACLAVYAAGLMMTHNILYSEMLWIVMSFPVILERSLALPMKARNQPAEYGFRTGASGDRLKTEPVRAIRQ